MGVIIDIDIEAGNLDEFNSTSTDEGDLSAHADAALAGTNYGMKLVINDATAIYGQITQGDTGTGDLRIRYYIDPNTLTMSDGDKFEIHYWGSGVSPWVNYTMSLEKSGSDYQLTIKPYNDAGSLAEDSAVITDDPHYVEIYIHQATNNSSNDGTIEWWINGVSKGTWTNVDNYDVFAGSDNMRFGMCSGRDEGTSGTFYIDQIKANNDGSEIGAHSPPAGIPILRRRRECA